MVKAVTTSMMIDSPLISLPSLHSFTEMNVSNRDREKRDRHKDVNQVLHDLSPESVEPDWSNLFGCEWSHMPPAHIAIRGRPPATPPFPRRLIADGREVHNSAP